MLLFGAGTPPIRFGMPRLPQTTSYIYPTSESIAAVYLLTRLEDLFVCRLT